MVLVRATRSQEISAHEHRREQPKSRAAEVEFAFSVMAPDQKGVRHIVVSFLLITLLASMRRVTERAAAWSKWCCSVAHEQQWATLILSRRFG